MSLATPARPVLASALLLLAAACGGGGGGGGGSTATIQGRIQVPATGAVFEAEPNDLPLDAQPLGAIYPGQTLQVVGTIDVGDPRDIFEVVAPVRVRIAATLAFDDSGGNEFDLGIFEPIAGDTVEAFLGTSSPATGTFHARGTFLPFVDPFAGDGTYTLTLVASTPADPIAEREPNDQHDEAQYLGAILDGDVVRMAGNANSAGDADDRFVFAVPADIDLSASLAMPGGANFDVVYTDVTDVLLPVEIARFDSLTANPETGSASIGALTMVEVAVEAQSGAGNYVLRVDAVASDDSPAQARAWRRADAARSLAGRVAIPAEQSFARPGWDALPGEVLVQPRADADLGAELARRGLAIAARIPGDVVRCVEAVPAWSTPEDARRRTLALVASLEASPAVEFAEPNILRRAYGTTPNDPFVDLQWHYAQIQLPAAWSLQQGDNAVRIGVIDTGRTDHPDMAGRLIDGFDFISSAQIAGDGNGVDVDETDVGDGQGPQPSSFHGTHVAGTIGAATDNGIGVAGVTWAGQIMHLRALGIGGGSTFDIANAVRHAAGLSSTAQPTIPVLAQPLDVINMSLGGPGFSQTFQNACSAAHAAGVVVFAAAGNENSTVPSFPASFDDVISVAAVDLQAKRAPYSNHNPDVDIAAPGGDTTKDLNGDGFVDGVLSTHRDDGVVPAEFVFSFLQGTSMACPHAAGVAALLLAEDPSLTPDQVEAILESTATDLGPAGKDNFFGHGLINAFQAVIAAGAAPPGPPVLVLSTQSLAFAPALSDLDVQVSNGGGGLLTVQAPIVSTDTGGNWLAAARVPVAAPTSTDTSAISVTVDRSGLPDGVFTGTVSVPSNGGTLDVLVALTVDSTPSAADVDIFVIAVDANTLDTVQQDVVNPSGSLNYSVASLPPGSYFVFAGSDDDGDLFLGSEGDRFLGAFPTLEQPVELDVGGGETLPAINFAVQSDFQGDAPHPWRGRLRLRAP